MSLKSVPLSQEISMNFGSVTDGKPPLFSAKNSPSRKTGGFTGPDWNHQKSFYSSDSSLSSPPASPDHRYSEPEYNYPAQTKPSGSSHYPRPNKAATSEVSLGDFVDVFVDDKFFKSHNVHYGPAIIHINNGGSGGSPVVTPNYTRSNSGLGPETRSPGSYSQPTNSFSPNHSPLPTNSHSPTSSGVSSISIGTDSPPDYHDHRENYTKSSFSPSPTPKSAAISPGNKFGGNFTYGPIPTGPSYARSNSHDQSGLDQSTGTGNFGKGQVISIGQGGHSSRRTSNGMVSFASEPEKVVIRSDGSPVDMNIVRGLRK